MKAKNPFYSLEARGKFADSLVANSVRGIQVLKKKSDPFDPKTNEQKSVREIYGEGVEDFKKLKLTARDRTALSRFARLYKFKLNSWQTWFKMYAIARKDFLTFPFVHDVRTSSTPSGKIHITCKFLVAHTLRVGLTHKFNQHFTWYAINELGASGNYQVHISNLMPGVKYYFVFRYVAVPYSPPWTQKITLWQDDFNDGNYNGWTVQAGTWTAVPLYLKGTTDAGKIITDTKVVPPGKKIWLYKHKHHGGGVGADSSALVILRYINNDYIMGFYKSRSAVDNYYALIEKVAGAFNVLYTSLKYNYYNERGNWFWIKVVKDGLIAKFKIWKDGESEPSAWDWEGNYTAGIVDDGEIQGFSQKVDAQGCGFDEIEIYRLIFHPAIQEVVRPASGMYSETIKSV